MEKNRKIVFIIIFLLNLQIISPVFSAPLCSNIGSITTECDLSTNLGLSGNLSLDFGGKINVDNKINIFANPNIFFLNAGTLNFLSSSLTTTSGDQSIDIDATLDLTNINNITFNGDFNSLSATYYLIKAVSFSNTPTSFSDRVISNITTNYVDERKYLQLFVNGNTLQANYFIDITINGGGKYVVPTTATQISNLIINDNATLSILENSNVFTINNNISLPTSFKIEFDFNSNNNAFDTAKTINFNSPFSLANSTFSFENFTASNYSTNKQFNLLDIGGGGTFTGITTAELFISGGTTNYIYKKNYIELSVINTNTSLIGTLKYDVVVNNGGDYAVNADILTKLTANNGGALTFQKSDVLQLVSIDLQNNSIINFDFSSVFANDVIGKISGTTALNLNLTDITLKSISLNTSSYAVGDRFYLLQLDTGNNFTIGAGQKAEISTTPTASNIENKYYLELMASGVDLIGIYRHDLTINDDGNYFFNKIEGFSNIIVGDVETASGENATLTIAKHTTGITKLTTDTLLFNTGSFLNFDLTGIAVGGTLAEYSFNNNVSLTNAEITLSGTLGFFQIGDEVIFFKKTGTANLTNLATSQALITTPQPISNVVLSQGFNLSINSTNDLVGSFFKDMTINNGGSVLFGNSVATNQGFSSNPDFHFNSITINANGILTIEDGIAPAGNINTPIIIEDSFRINGLTGSYSDNFDMGKTNKIEIKGAGLIMQNWANVVLGADSILNTTGFSMKTQSWFFMDENSTLNISATAINNTDIDNTAIIIFANGSKINFTATGGVNNNTNLQFGMFGFAIEGIMNSTTPIAEITGLTNNLQLPTELQLLFPTLDYDDFWARVAGDKILLLKINKNFTGTLNPNELNITNFYGGSYINDPNVERKKYFTFTTITNELYATFGNDVNIKKGGNLVSGNEVFNNFTFTGCGASDLSCLLNLYPYVRDSDYFGSTSQTATLTIKENSNLKVLNSLNSTGLNAFNFDFTGVTGAATFLGYTGDNFDALFNNITINFLGIGNITLPQTIITFSNISNNLIEGTDFTLIKVIKLNGTDGDLSAIQGALDYYNNLRKKVSNNEILATNVIASRRMYLDLDDNCTAWDPSGNCTNPATPVSNQLVGKLLIDVVVNSGGELLFNAATRNGAQYTTLKVNSGGTLTIGDGADFTITGYKEATDTSFNFAAGAKLKFDMTNYTGGGYTSSNWNAASLAKITYVDDIDITTLNINDILATGYSDPVFKAIFDSEFGKQFTLIEGRFVGSTALNDTMRVYFDDCVTDCSSSDPLVTYKKGLQLIGSGSTFTNLEAKFISDVWVASGGNLIFDDTLNYQSKFSNIIIEANGDLTIKKGADFEFDKLFAEGTTSEIIFDLTGFTPNQTNNALLKLKNNLFQIAGTDITDSTYNDDYTAGVDIIDIKHFKIAGDTSSYNENDNFLLIEFLQSERSLDLFFGNANTYIKVSDGSLTNDTVNGIYGCITAGADNCINMSSGFNLYVNTYARSSTTYTSLFAKYTNSLIIKDDGFFKIVGERKFGLLQLGDQPSNSAGGTLVFTKNSILSICEGGTAGGACTNTDGVGFIITANSTFDFDFENVVAGDILGKIKQGFTTSGFIIYLDNIKITAKLNTDTSGIGGTTDYNVGDTFTLLRAEDFNDGTSHPTTFDYSLFDVMYFSNGTSTTDATTNLDEALVSYMKGLSLTNDGVDFVGTYILDARIQDEGNLTIDSSKRFSTLYVGDDNPGGQENAKLTFKTGGALSVDGISGISSGLIFEEGSQLLFNFDGYTFSASNPLATIDDTSGVAVNFYNVRNTLKLTKGSGVLTSGDQIILLQGLNSTSFINEDNVFNPYDFNSGNPLHFTDEDDDTTDLIDRFRYIKNLDIATNNTLIGDYFYDATVKNGGEIIFGDAAVNRETEQNIQNLKINEGGTLTFAKNTSATALIVDSLTFNADTFPATPTNKSILNFDLSGWNGSGELAYINNSADINFSNVVFSGWLNSSTYNIDDQLVFLQSTGADFTGTFFSNSMYFEDGTNEINFIEYKKSVGLEISADKKQIVGTYKYGLTILDDGILEIPAGGTTKYSFLKVGDNARHTSGVDVTHPDGYFATLSFFKNSNLVIADTAAGSFALNNGAHLNFNFYQSKNPPAGGGCGTGAAGDTCQNAVANDTIAAIQSAGTTSTISLNGVKFTASLGTDNTTATGTADYNVGDTFKLLALALTSTDTFIDDFSTSQIFFDNGTPLPISNIKYRKGLDLSLVDSDKTIQGKYRYDVEVLKGGTLSISGSNNTFSKLLVGEGDPTLGVATLRFVNGAFMDVKENITFRDDAELIFDFAGYIYIAGNTLITYNGAALDFNPLTTDVVTLTGYADSFFTAGTTMTLIDATSTSITDGFSNNVGKVYFDDFTSSLGANIDENKGLKIQVVGDKLEGVFIHDVTVQNTGELLIDMDKEYTALKVETGGLVKFKMASPSTSLSTILKLETFEIENAGKLDFDFVGVTANMPVPLIELEINHDLNLTNTIISLSNADLLDTYNAGDRFVLLKLDDTNAKGISFTQQSITFSSITPIPNVVQEIGLVVDREHIAGAGDSLVGKFIKNIRINDDGIYTINATEKFSILVVGDIDTVGNENATLSFKKDSDLTIFDTITLNSGSVFKFNFNGVDGTAGNDTIGKINIAGTGLSLLDLTNTKIEVDLGSEIYTFGQRIKLLESDIEISGITSRQVYSPASWSEDDDASGNADQNINVEYKKGFVVGRSTTNNKILEGEYIYSVVVHGKDKNGVVAGDGGKLRISSQVGFSTLNIGEAGETNSATLILGNGAKINDATNHLNTFIFAQNAKLKFDLTGFGSGGTPLSQIWTDGDVDLTNLNSADFEIELGGANLVVGQDITLMKIMTSTSFININDIQSITIEDATISNIKRFKFLDVAFNTGGTTLSGVYTYNANVESGGNMIFGVGMTETDTEADYTFSNMVVESGGTLTLNAMEISGSDEFALNNITNAKRKLKTKNFKVENGGTLNLKEGAILNVETILLNGDIEFDFSGVVAGETIATIETAGNGISLMNSTIKLTNFNPASLNMTTDINLIELTGGNQITFADTTSYFDTYPLNSDAGGVKVAYGLKLKVKNGGAGVNNILAGVGVKDLYVRDFVTGGTNGIKEFATTETYSTIYVGFKSDTTDTSIEKGKIVFKNGADLTFDDLKFKTGSIIEFDFTGISSGGTIANITTTATNINLGGVAFEISNLTADAGDSFTLLDSNQIINLGSPRFVRTNQYDIPEVAVDTEDVLEISLDATFKKIMGTYTKAVVIHKTGVLTIGSTANPNFSTTNLKVGDANAPTTAGTGDANYGTLLFQNGGDLTVTSIDFTSGVSKLAFDLTGYTITNPLAVINNTNSISLGTLSKIEITQGTGNNFDINDEIILLSTNGLTTYTRPTQISFADTGNNTTGADDILRNKYLYDIKIDSNKLIGKYGYDVEVKSAGNLKFGSAGSETDTQFSKITIENGGILTLSNKDATNIELVIDKNLTFQSGSKLEFRFENLYSSANLIKIDDNTNIDISIPSDIFLSGYGYFHLAINTINTSITLIEMTGTGNITGISQKRVYFDDEPGISTPTIEDKYGLLLSIDAGNLKGKFIHDVNVLSGGDLVVASVVDPYNNVNVKTGGKITFKDGDVLESESVNFELNSMLDFDLSNLAPGTLAQIKTDSLISLSNIRNNITINKGTGSTFKVGDTLYLLEIDGTGSFGGYAGNTIIYFDDFGGASGLNDSEIYRYKFLKNVGLASGKLKGEYVYNIEVKDTGRILFSANASDGGREEELEISTIKVQNGGTLTLKEQVVINTTTNTLQTLTFETGSQLEFDFTNATIATTIGTIYTAGNVDLRNAAINLANLGAGYNVDDTFKLLEISAGKSINVPSQRISSADVIDPIDGYTTKTALDLSLSGGNVLQGKYRKDLIVDNNSQYNIINTTDKYNSITISTDTTSAGTLIVKNGEKLEATEEIVFNEGSVLKFDFTGISTLSTTELFKLSANNSTNNIDLSRVKFELTGTIATSFTGTTQKFLQLESGTATRILLNTTNGKNLIYFNETSISSNVEKTDIFELSVQSGAYDALIGSYKKGVRVKNAGNFLIDQTYPTTSLYDIVSVEDGGTLTFANNGVLKTKSIIFADDSKLVFNLNGLNNTDLSLATISDITTSIDLGVLNSNNITITKGGIGNTFAVDAGNTITLLTTNLSASYYRSEILFTGDIDVVNNVDKKRYLSGVNMTANILSGTYKYDITINSGNDELRFGGIGGEAETTITTLTAKSGGILTFGIGADITIEKMTFEAGSTLEFDFTGYTTGDFATIDNTILISLNNATINLTEWNGGTFFTKDATLTLIKKGGTGLGITGYNTAKRWYFDESEDDTLNNDIVVADNDSIYNVFAYKGLELLNVADELQGTFIYDLFVKTDGQYSLAAASAAQYSNTYIKSGAKLLLKKDADLITDNLIFETGSMLHFVLDDYVVGTTTSLATITNISEIKLNNLTAGAIIIEQGNATPVVGDVITLFTTAGNMSGYQPVNNKVMFNDSTGFEKGFLKDIAINSTNDALTGKVGLALVVEDGLDFTVSTPYTKTFNYVSIENGGNIKFKNNSIITITDNDGFTNAGTMELWSNASLKLNGAGGKLVNDGIIVIGEKDNFSTAKLDVVDISLTGGELHFLIDKKYDTTALNPLLTITTAASDISLANTKIKLFSQTGSTNLDVGKEIKLMQTNKIFVGTPKFDDENEVVEIHAGWTKIYYADLLNEGNKLIATITEKSLAEETKALNESAISSSLALINTLSFVETAVVRDVIYNSNSGSNSGLPNQNLGTLFASNVGYSKTITGSYVESMSGNVVVGFDAYNALLKNLNVAAFVEASSTNFTTHNDFSSGIMELKGTNKSFGAGGLGIYRYEFESGNALSFEMSIHSGFIMTELVDDLHAEYDYKLTSAYFAGHTGLTYSYYTGGNTYIDFYGKLLLTNNLGGETEIETTDTLKVKPFTAKRIKSGVNFNGNFNDETNYYIGGGVMYDLEAKQESTLDNLKVESTSIAGSSVMFSGGINGSFTYNFKYNAGVELTSGKTTSANVTLGIKYIFNEEVENAYKYNRRPSFSGDGYGSGGRSGGYDDYGTMNKFDAKKKKAEEYKKQFEEELKRKDTSAGIVKGESNKNKGKKKRKDDDDSVIKVERVVELEEETRTDRQNAY